MKYLLDTNTCVRFLNRRSPAIIAKFATVVDSDIAVCSIVKGEMFAGAAKSNTVEFKRVPGLKLEDWEI